MADQITKSVRRIVKGMKDDPLGLGEAEDYKGIGTSRGEAFINSRGDVTASGSDGSSEDKDEQPSSGTPETGTPDDNDTGGGGGVNNGSDPANSLAGDVADVDAAITSDSQIGTLTGTDPATANLTSLNLNTLEGIEYVPPPGWDSPDSEGDVDTWAGVTLDQFNGCQIGCPASSSAAEVRTWDPSTGYTWVVTQWIDVSTPNTLAGFDVVNNCTSCAGFATHFPQLLRSTGTTAEPPPLPDTDWPSDSNCQVVYDSEAGGYKGNEKDTDCSAEQKTATDFVIIRSASDPSKYFRYTKLANGGTKITQVDSGGVPVPGSITKTTDEGGRIDGFYDVSLDASIT